MRFHIAASAHAQFVGITALCGLLAATQGCEGVAGFGAEKFELGTCNLVTNSGCTTAEMCVDLAAPHCAPAGNAAAGSPCTADSDCVASTVCVGAGDRFCRARCDVTQETCLGGDLCTTGLSAGVSTPYQFGYCSPCNPVSNELCPPQQTCYMTATPFCGGFGTVDAGQACEKASDCLRETACVSMAGAKTCMRKCDASLGFPQGQCSGSEICYALKASDGVPFPEHGGVCRPK